MARGEFPSSKQDQFVLRFPDGLRDRVKEKAEANGRSMNAEIVAAIESTIDQPDLSASDLRKMLDEERAMSAKATMLLDSQFELIGDYKRVIDTARGQSMQQAGIITSLCNIISSMEPSPEVLEFAKRLSDTSNAFLKRAKQSEILDSARKEAASLNQMIERADAILKPKDKK